MLEDMTLSKGRPLATPFSWSLTRYSSALIASSPRTAYCTLRTAGLRLSTERGCMDKVEEDEKRRGCSQRKPIVDRILTKFDKSKGEGDT